MDRKFKFINVGVVMQTRRKGGGRGGGGRSVNPISTRGGAHYLHPVLCPPQILRPCDGPVTYAGFVTYFDHLVLGTKLLKSAMVSIFIFNNLMFLIAIKLGCKKYNLLPCTFNRNCQTSCDYNNMKINLSCKIVHQGL